MNTEQLDTILEEEILKSAEEVCKIVDMPGRRQLEENEAELMKRNTVDQLKDEFSTRLSTRKGIILKNKLNFKNLESFLNPKQQYS